MKKNFFIILIIIINFLFVPKVLANEKLCVYEGVREGVKFETIISTAEKNYYYQYQITINRNGMLLERSDWFEHSNLGLNTNQTDYTLKFTNVNVSYPVLPTENNVFFSQNAVSAFLEGNCPRVSYHAASSVCFAMANETAFCNDKNKEFLKQEIIYESTNREDLNDNTYDKEDAEEAERHEAEMHNLCTYKGISEEGESLEVNLYYIVENNLPLYHFAMFESGNKIIDSNGLLSGGWNFNVAETKFTEFEGISVIKFSGTAHQKFKQEECPEVIYTNASYFEPEGCWMSPVAAMNGCTHYTRGFCLQQSSESFCYSVNPNNTIELKLESSNLGEDKTDFNIPNYDGSTAFQNPFGGDISCDTIFKNANGGYNRTYYLMQNIFKIIKYVAIILVVALSIADFVKAITLNDKDVLNKTISKSIKRLIIGIVIFFVPTLINFILELISEYTACNII